MLAVACFGCVLAGGATADPATLVYDALFQLELEADEPVARAAIQIDQDRGELIEVGLRAPERRYSDFAGPGVIRRDGDRLIWAPPAAGGTLRYRVVLPNKRNRSGFDSHVDRDWAIFRADDVFPPMSTRHEDGARSDSRLQILAPADWRVATPYPESKDGSYAVDNPNRNLDRPTGWIATGRVAIRRESIAGTQVTVAGPLGAGVQRIGMLALMRWTLPTLTARLPLDLPRVTIVSAGDPMWRGGLSGPNSLYIHAERPLISEDATSTLLHEILHVAAPVKAAPNHDWIDEGLAEYLTLVTLSESGSISAERFAAAVERKRNRGKKVDSMATRQAKGAVAARATAIFHELDRELAKATDGRENIFTLTAALMQEAEPVTLASLRRLARELADDQAMASLSNKRVPGFD